MADARDQQADLLQQAVDSCRQEHQDLSSQWANLDGKAQSAITIAGVFLAATLAFIRELAESASDVERILLTATLALLIVSTVFALLVVRLRPVVAAPCGAPLTGMIDDLISTKDAADAHRLRNFARDHASLWRKANESVSEAVTRKARNLQWAQWLLFGAILAAAAVTTLKIWEQAWPSA